MLLKGNILQLIFIVALIKILIMTDLGLYENFLEHVRVMQSLISRRQSQSLRNMEITYEMPDPKFVGLYLPYKGVCPDLVSSGGPQELKPYLPSRRGEGEDFSTESAITLSMLKYLVCDSDLNIISIDACHGGANHNSFVWDHHPLKSHFEQLHLWFLETHIQCNCSQKG